MFQPLIQETVEVGGRRLRLARPARPEDLIDEHEFGEDEFLPYWAELWPSALALAHVVAGADLRGKRVIELGCGLGLPSLAAAAGGAQVVATDWSVQAVRSTEANAARNRLRVEGAVWRWSADAAPLDPPFDLVLGADLLYERRNAAWLLGALERLLAAGSEAWIADPGRAAADAFLAAAPGSFRMDGLEHDGPESVTVHRLRRF